MPLATDPQTSGQRAVTATLFWLHGQSNWADDPATRYRACDLAHWRFDTALSLPHALPALDWGIIGGSTVLLPAGVWAELERLYSSDDYEQVMWYLEAYPFLASLLVEAGWRLGCYFPGSEAHVELVGDKEVLDEYQLVVSVATEFDADEALAALDAFDREWWVDAVKATKGRLCVNIEFK